MSFRVGRTFAAALVISLCIQMHIAENGYASRGTKIAFTSSNDGNKDIYVMDGDGKNQRRVTVNPADDSHPAWSPNGKKIAFVSNRNRGYIQIWVIDADMGNPIRLTDGLWDAMPDWSPDGTKIAYQAFRKKELDIPLRELRREIYVMDADGSRKRRLTDEGGVHPSWSPDGKKIAYTHGQIYVMDADGRNRNRITNDFVHKRMPCWSPDGMRIAYASEQQIFVMDSNGESRKQLTEIFNERPMRDDHPTWSPDSETIAFHSWGKWGKGIAIFTIDVTSGAVNPLEKFQGQGGWDPDWLYPGELSVSPEGSRVTMWGRLKKFASSLR